MADFTVQAFIDSFMISATEAGAKAVLALENVDNTSDANKPISTATQAALDLKGSATDVATNTTHRGLTNNPHTVTKAQVGLANVDNTSDASKPVSGPTQTALNLKADNATVDPHIADNANPHNTNKTHVGLGNVDNTADADKPVSDDTVTALALKADTTDLTAHTGDTANPHSTTKTHVGLGNVDNTSDLNKPISTATQTALDGKVDDPIVGNHTATMTPETSGTITLSGTQNILRYRKTWTRVDVQGYIGIDSVSSPVGGYVAISLPYILANLGNHSSVGGATCYNNGTPGAEDSIGFYANKASSEFRVFINAATLATGHGFYVTFSYETT